MRSEKKLVVHQIDEEFCAPSRTNAVENSMVLKPVLARLSRHATWKLPYLEDLKIEVQTIYERCGLDATEKLVYSTSVDIKRLTGLVKRRCKRHEVTRAGCYSKYFCYSSPGCSPKDPKTTLVVNILLLRNGERSKIIEMN